MPLRREVVSLLAALGIAGGASDPASRAAACYVARYPDLKREFCNADGACNLRQAKAHFRERGRREARRFGCDSEANGTALARVVDDDAREHDHRIQESGRPPPPRARRDCPAPASPHSVVVLARILYEQPFLAGFVDWYAARGVECVLLVCDKNDGAGNVEALPSVAVQRTAPPGKHPNAVIQACLADVRATGYAWVLVVDADEYLALHPRFDRSLPRFIENAGGAGAAPRRDSIQLGPGRGLSGARAVRRVFRERAREDARARGPRGALGQPARARAAAARHLLPRPSAEVPRGPERRPRRRRDPRAPAGRGRGVRALRLYGRPARDRLHFARVPGRVRAEARARPSGRVRRRRTRARPRPEHDERARQGVWSGKAGPRVAGPARG